MRSERVITIPPVGNYKMMSLERTEAEMQRGEEEKREQGSTKYGRKADNIRLYSKHATKNSMLESDS